MTLEATLILGLYAAGAAATVPLLRRLGFDTRLGSANRLAVAPLLVAGAANLAIAGAVLGVLRALRPDPALPLGLGVGGRDVIVAMAAMTASGAASLLDARVRGARLRPPRALQTLAVLLVALACAAWMEEVVFRAALLHVLAPAGTVAAVGGSALLFTVIHVPTARVERQALLRWGVGGVALAVVYLVSGSVIVAAAAHLARNAGNVMVYDATPVAVTKWPAPPAALTRTLNAVTVSLLPVAVTLLAYR
jgi:membrane protease YdiL (CAAX protease family)